MSALWDTIDLNRHGIIEAHAGTGKTYTIVKLVLRILEQPVPDVGKKERFIHIREILIVTFTEKAAGELKDRIRKGLEGRIVAPSLGTDVKSHLENCLNNLHEALIGTIHAICLRLLQTWPFESGVQFDTEIIDDSEGLVSALRESMRIDWQNESTNIPWVLEQMRVAGKRIEEKHFELLRSIAKELLDEDHVKLDRTPLNGWNLGSIRSSYDTASEVLNREKPAFLISLRHLISALQTASDSGAISTDKTALFDVRLKELREMSKGTTIVSRIIQDPCKCGTPVLYTKTEHIKNPLLATAEKYRNEIKQCLFTETQLQKESLEDKILLTLIGDAAELLALRWKRTKQEKGFISYQDMLRLMYRAVTGHPSFTRALRAKLRYAIIDEFQDTSRLQWEMFNSLFLKGDESGAPRLFLVGDPKQSIYAFQGADVHSYLDARCAVIEHGGVHYALGHNFRSLDSTIKGYNSVFVENINKENWFKFDNPELGINYPADSVVTSPDRKLPPPVPPAVPPFLVVPLIGSATRRKAAFAESACRAIQRLTGTTLSVPDGLDWRSIQLEYRHFAVIVETHNHAEVFLDAFREAGIPAVKYKMAGVFQSPMARALHALLEAVRSPSGDPARRLAALLTHFFNRSPQSVDPEHDLDPCPDATCRGDDLCIAHALEEWTALSANANWARLFESIQRRTGIYERLIRLRDGERHIADLHQVVDYCIEQLYCRKFSLVRLTEHLRRMLDEEESAGEERNLHVLETQKSSVKVLTMHAAKGLEFPVVFAATGSSKTARKGPSFVRFTDSDSAQAGNSRFIKIAPYLSTKDIKITANGKSPESIYLEQAQQERRRLLYVALTRAQALLFVPMHFETLERTSDGSIYWPACTLPSKGPDNDLTPRLQELLSDVVAGSPIALLNVDMLPSGKIGASGPASDLQREISIEPAPEIVSLKLLARICRQTSYSQLSRESTSSRDLDRSDEVDIDDGESLTTRVPSPLPGGKQTGDALHCAIEEILKSDSTMESVRDDNRLKNCVEKYLKRNGVLAHIRQHTPEDDNAVNNAVLTGMNCVRGALTTKLQLTDTLTLDNIVALAAADRKAEMEFLLCIGNHWLHGYMDMVFRIPIPGGGAHPWRYFVLDWKSDSLGVFDKTTINHCIKQRHYDLQAQLYCHALDRFLSGVLGSDYLAAEHLGGAVYVFLREHETSPQAAATVWTHDASPIMDARFTASKVASAYA